MNAALSVASVMSVTNDESDNEIILGAVHRSPDICLTAEENLRKPQLGDRLMKGLCDQSSPQMGYRPPKEVGRMAQYVRKEKGRNEGKYGSIYLVIMFPWFLGNKYSNLYF